MKRHGNIHRFRNVQLRIGNANSDGKGRALLAANPLAGYIDDWQPEPNHVFKLKRPFAGLYLTLQMMTKQYLEVDEVDVNIKL